jgi:predicted nucleic acid-binding protein
VVGLIESYGLSVVTPTSHTYQRFNEIIQEKEFTSKIDIFDNYLAATFMENGINQLLTVNTTDFAGIPGFKAINPFVPNKTSLKSM